MRTNGRSIYESKINDSIKDNNVTQTKIAFRCIANYFASILTHGFSSDITKDNLAIISEARDILDEEKMIYIYLKGILDDVNESALNALLERMKVAHNKAMSYYYNFISQIEMSHKGDTIKIDKDFDHNNEGNGFRRDALSLSRSLEDVITWLDYPDDFRKFIEGKIIIQPLPSNFDEDYEKYTSILRLRHNDDITNIHLYLPEIVDYNSTLRCIELLEEAYSLYCEINKKDKQVFDNDILKKSYANDLDSLGDKTFGSR